MSTPVKTLLKQMGLSEIEVHVYLACLHLGETIVAEIAHKTKTSRTTVASILDRLKAKGLLTSHLSKGKKIFWIEDPHILVEHHKAQLEVIEQLAGRLHNEYHQADKKPTAEIYDTPETLEHLMAKVVEELKKGDDLFTFESPSSQHYQAILTEELFHALSKQKARKGIHTKSLIPTGQELFIRPKFIEHNIEVRVLPLGVLIESSFWMFKNSLVLFSGTHTFAVRINHGHMKESITSLFQMAWKLSKPLEQKTTLG
ncbi:MAG: Transcriptional regulator, TrmB [Candidatus Uhrbacteria bacterium GW2011_GWF2_39_13]|uniref:Transcriptional regulator, TrmB n=1 Tax=Candidatus Uhrbacteria bacterium GW2011_GWF2_39_13 TaxID=1618995 RepID=A0A0G0Q1P6_9BACT|nr:MAG: Transcriptional regulator, TrmB [Candidatus Uhrbacteria bacterium GW2011_GWF2_39_13]HAU66608.1 hypothetical protein [Candidatus Uhrbacteria bacterium]